jgi:hypothetical protein
VKEDFGFKYLYFFICFYVSLQSSHIGFRALFTLASFLPPFPLVQPGVFPMHLTPVSTTTFLHMAYHLYDGGCKFLRSISQYLPCYIVLQRTAACILVTMGTSDFTLCIVISESANFLWICFK